MQISLCILGMVLMLVGHMTSGQSVQNALVSWIKSIGIVTTCTLCLGLITALLLHGVVIDGNITIIFYGIIGLAVLRAVWIRVGTII